MYCSQVDMYPPLYTTLYSTRYRKFLLSSEIPFFSLHPTPPHLIPCSFCSITKDQFCLLLDSRMKLGVGNQVSQIPRKSAYNFKLALYIYRPLFYSCEFNEIWILYSSMHLLKKFVYNWIPEVQTSIVQRSAIYNLYYFVSDFLGFFF